MHGSTHFMSSAPEINHFLTEFTHLQLPAVLTVSNARVSSPSVKYGFLSISLPSLHELQHNWAAICVEKVQIYIFSAGCAVLPSNAAVIVVHLSFTCSIFRLTVEAETNRRCWHFVWVVFDNDHHLNLFQWTHQSVNVSDVKQQDYYSYFFAVRFFHVGPSMNICCGLL